MAGPDPAFPVKRPLSAWNRPLKLDAKGLFGALGRGTLHGVTGQWTELGSDAVDTLSALGIDGRDAPQLAWLLLRRSLLSAMAELTREAAPLVGEMDKDNLEQLSDRLDELLEKEEVSIDRALFKRPRDLPLLSALQDPFAEWLQAYGLDPAASASVSRRLPSYFVAALHAEWRRSPGTYEPVREAVDTPFTRAAERERAWALYAAQLERQVDEPMFGEAFGLRQVYVPLRGFYMRDPSQDRVGGPEAGKDLSLEGSTGLRDIRDPSQDRVGGLEAGRDLSLEGPTGLRDMRDPSQDRVGSFEAGRDHSLEGSTSLRVAVQLKEEIDAWLASEDRYDGYRVISGGPGSGKSSFARMYAARGARQTRFSILFIPLHQLNITGALVPSVGEYVRLAGLLPENPLDPKTGENRLLVLFDGLDELSLQGRVGADVAKDFVREVLRVVEIRNQSIRRLIVLFTGREPVVQASESEFRNRRCILHVLPYLIDKNSQHESLWHSGRKLLVEDARQSWWQLYGQASGQRYSGLPEELSRPDLDEITAQPLLNYLVALSQSRGRLKFFEDLNLNNIYENLLEAVHERAYEQKRPHAAIQGLSLQEFRRVLEEIALAAWHGNGRTTSLGEIEAHCETAGLSGLLKRFAEGAQAGVTRVLTAFYFRQFGRTTGGDPTFEFTHKSFREYLTALRIVRALERIEEEIERRRTSFDKGWDEREALRHWAEICGPSRMDRELWVFIHREIQRKGKELAWRWQKLICGLLALMLRNGMPMELLSPRPSYAEEARRALHSEEALLATLNACAETTRKLSRIEWPETEGGLIGSAVFGAWINKLQGQRTGPENVLALQCLSFLDLSHCILYFVDLYAAHLEGAILEGANLEGANLEGANLKGANLEGANLEGANLKGVNLEGANLKKAHLEGVNLEGANLREAYMRGRIWRGRS